MRRMDPADGVYLLADSAGGNELLLSKGDWHFGSVKATRGDNDPFRTWLLARPPGAEPNTYVLVNVQSGTFAGVWKDEWGRGDHHVKCSPSHISAANIQWTASPGDPGQDVVVLNWVGDLTRMLMRDGNGEHVVAHSPGDSRQWRLSKTNPEFEAFPDWMGHLPDDIRLHEINLPTTHQSLANHGISKVRPDLNWNHLGDGQPRPWGKLPAFIDNPRCQECSLWDQLQMGVRGFDIRLDLDLVPVLKRDGSGQLHEEARYYLYARHGLAEMGFSWSAVLLILRCFLRNNPSEFVIVNVRYEKATPASVDRGNDWMSAFVDETSMFWNEGEPVVYKWWESGSRIMNDLAVTDVRGKIIFTTDGNYMPADGAEGRNQGARFFPTDMSAVGKYDSKRDEWDQQLRMCENNINDAKTNDRPERYYQTSFNVSGLPAPLKYPMAVQSLFHNPLHARTALREAKEDWSNEVFDPIDFFSYFQGRWSARGVDCPLSEERLGKNGHFRVGKIDIDFCNRMQGWVANIVRSNRTLPGREW